MIWETRVPGKFDPFIRTYYRGGHGFLLLYDISNRNSFEAIKNYWIKEILMFSD